ncbi:MAG: MlaD family protein, partial [Chitinispirillaceae bacterium]|nr:MlaD family protein [Chitinispirillaceae bacterium]
MKKNEVDFIVGSSIIVAIVILITGVLWLKEISITRRMASFGVLFPNVGTLQVGDPVMVNGVVKGRVKSIFLRDKEVATIIEVEKSVKLTDSCKVAIQNIGLMGERGVGIY